MPLITPNFSEVPKPLDAGTYPGRILSAVPGVSKSGNEKVVVKAEINADGKVVEREAHLPISGKGARSFLRLLRACGFEAEADRMAAGEEVPFDTDALAGQDVMCVIGTELYNGELQDRLEGFQRR